MARSCLLAIRIRGGVNVESRKEATLRMLRIDRNNYATLIDDRPDYLGMLQKVKDYVTWGEPTPETVKHLLERRGEAPGGGAIDAETLKSLGFDDLEGLSKALTECSIDFSKLEVVKPFFRLHPPRKGFKKTIKRFYTEGGELGYRGEAINDLAIKMS